MKTAPNVVYIFADEMRMQDAGYAGNRDVQTPTMDRLAGEGLNLTHAVSGCPVCCPYRGSLMTGQYPLTHGVYINDVELNPNCDSIAHAFKRGGYDTAYIGKWHLYGSPDGKYGRRQAYVPRDYQLGFDYWKAFECTHDYNDSHYYFNDDDRLQPWGDYDARAQSQDAAQYIRDHAEAKTPYMMVLSWGPPHFPLHTAPQEYQDRFAHVDIELRPNVSADKQAEAREELRGNYAHIAALDDCLATVLDAIDASGQRDNTIVVFTSDHGDMFGSQGINRKSVPWDESIRVSFLLRWPAALPTGALPLPLDAPDIMPTLLGLCELEIPATVQGQDYSAVLRGEQALSGDEAALLNLPAAFANVLEHGFKAYRGLRTQRYTYVRNTDGPWLLFDNEADPYQMCNLVGSAEHADVQSALESRLQHRLAALGDEFLDGQAYLERDGLSHYQEVNRSCHREWQDPWSRH